MDILDPPMDVLNQPVDILDCPQKPVHQTDESQGVLTESASVVSHFEEKPFELVKPSSAPIENGTECEVDQPLVENQPEQVDQLVVPETISMEEDTNVEMLLRLIRYSRKLYEPRVDLTPNMVGESVQEGINEQEGGINNMQCDVWQPSMTENCDKIIPQQAEEIIPAQIPEEVAEQKEIQETCSEPSEDNFSEGVHDLPVDEKVCEETSVDIDCDRTNLNSSDLNRTESNSLVMETIEENLISNIEESAEELAAKEMF
ncbi:hypothetical protein JTB14_011770 [Gonioctena quinquepunctata]|nr:hypothetical protein JTB14_011770 [Gonioctena quinquepunctata]